MNTHSAMTHDERQMFRRRLRRIARRRAVWGREWFARDDKLTVIELATRLDLPMNPHDERRFTTVFKLASGSLTERAA